MLGKMPPRIAAVGVVEAPLTIRVQWANGHADTIDVSSLARTMKHYAPLLDDPALFDAVHVGEYGADIVWTQTIDMSNVTLWRLAREQSAPTP